MEIHTEKITLTMFIFKSYIHVRFDTNTRETRKTTTGNRVELYNHSASFEKSFSNLGPVPNRNLKNDHFL